MGAALVIRDKQVLGNVVVELVVWLLDEPVVGCIHRFKYRLYAGFIDGGCIVRYDNERGKGDHKHIGGMEAPYRFRGIVELIDDFAADVGRLAP